MLSGPCYRFVTGSRGRFQAEPQGGPGRKYQALYDAFSGIDTARTMFSERVTNRSKTSASGLRDYLWRYMDANDGLMVVCFDGSAGPG